MAAPLGSGDNHFWDFQWEWMNDPSMITCSITLFISGVMCSAGGIGGGGVYVVVLMLAGGLSPHDAVPLSKAVVFLGSVATLVVNMGHLEGDKVTVIDFDVCRLVSPWALAGTFIGVTLNWHSADYTLVVVLTLVLIGMSVSVCRTASRQFHAELSKPVVVTEMSERTAESGDEKDRDVAETAPLISSVFVHPRPEASDGSPQHKSFSLILLLMLVVVVSSVVRFHLHACREEMVGDPNVGDACEHPVMQVFFGGRSAMWAGEGSREKFMEMVISCLPVVMSVALGLYYSHQLLATWSVQRVVLYQATSLVTGILAGLVGIGGGLIFAPFFLLTGLEPSLAVGTSSTCVLCTSSSTTIQYILTDRVINPLALVYGVVTLISSFVGTTLVHHLHKVVQRQSYITMLVAVGVAVSAVLSSMKFLVLVGATGGTDLTD